MKTVLFGRNSMIGRGIIYNWSENEHGKLIALSKEDCDCLDPVAVSNVLVEQNPTHVISLVGYNGNIVLNNKAPATICGDTVRMNMNVMDACTHSKSIKKVLTPITSCAYGYTQNVLCEEEFLLDPIHHSVLSHGFARRFLFVYGQQLNKQFGNKFIFPIFNNCYGPFDRFAEPERLKVFGTLVQRFIRAADDNDSHIVIWGTGNARREGLFSYDAGSLIIQMLMSYDDYEMPLNLGLGTDISIRDLSYLLKDLTGFKGGIQFDDSKPEGQLKKLLDTTRAKSLGLTPQYTLEQGLTETINWYRSNYVY